MHYYKRLIIYRSQRQNSCSSSHEVPYARLIDSPGNRKPGQCANNSTPISGDSDIKFKAKSIRMPTPKSSVSESKLTVDYFQKSDISVKTK